MKPEQVDDRILRTVCCWQWVEDEIYFAHVVPTPVHTLPPTTVPGAELPFGVSWSLVSFTVAFHGA